MPRWAVARQDDEAEEPSSEEESGSDDEQEHSAADVAEEEEEEVQEEEAQHAGREPARKRAKISIPIGRKHVASLTCHVRSCK